MDIRSLVVKVTGGVLVFLAGYLVASFTLFPSSATHLLAWARLALPANLEHTTAKSALQPGERVVLGALRLASGEVTDRAGRPSLAIVFDINCVQAAGSNRFWNRLVAELSQRNVSTWAVACGESQEAVSQFAHQHLLRMPVYYPGKCDVIPPRLSSPGGIRLYLLTKDDEVLHAWAGRPIFRYTENDAIAQILSRAEPSR